MMTRRRQQGFTLIELVVVLAILGILVALAVPRYLSARRNALVAEANNVLQELKTTSWGYYQQYSSWVSLPVGPLPLSNPLGIEPPGGGCWDYSIESATATQVTFRATANPTAVTRCGALDATNTVDLLLNNDGSSVRTQSFF
jgi:prepilin-type N-terminal cleavage/methylation domain-containing protein